MAALCLGGAFEPERSTRILYLKVKLVILQVEILSYNKASAFNNAFK